MNRSYLGVKNGRLSGCPQTPNCVSTQTNQTDKKMSPLDFAKDLETTKQLVKEVLNQMERTTVVTESENYLHCIVRTKWIKFKDDVEFYFDEDTRTVHFRSASRVGYSDFGVNKKRMKEFTEHYESMKGD
ncbi:Uncharacterized conserved protein, DUF1499 family [Halobacillus dabanensis]|uniref:Uncharacterized conserved protein, DUF1499 family n=1 Tax=Halobacillus dabanensis TaxID=240302 RepID=A0A1I3ST58_HALDA|nr:DUF1499 domain-containing protein [Halobacillus dabanensis]SFJ61422.1 Uncharacterized conserved protein, DUF1499 family [Halobacillus dabanensis]